MLRRSFFGWISAALSSTFLRRRAPEPEDVRASFTDLRSMLDAIRDHVRETGHVVLSADRPVDHVVGFVTFEPGRPENDRLFEIGIEDLRRSLRGRPDLDPGVRELFMTQAGRAKIAMAFPGQAGRSSSPTA